ncbi:DNA-3-methyladenine glycosylase [Pilimelia terevasa]|uniref:DNA-3-methyladenine glycosylase II n=1 Tax=Pilimelia terevasa TaxID=53372 RepID=A0A8J3BK49_9ACTN|nr:AlkA N-terminal domain-containing protein [Pilimelia terevasa]GGK16589.1 DNA-3-methyladenine glycosylase [Pilimelia terevasa]
MELDFARCYRAVDSRDPRFDGWFYTAVTSTRIYCRPSCPATTPQERNVRFYPSAAAAQRAGFRACRRCRPDAAPGSPEWDGRADTVGRAMRLIGDGLVDREGVPGLAARLGYTTRHLHRLLTEELGAGPLALARSQRAQTARTLIESTDLGLAEIAFAAGFGSVRQFNETVAAVYAATPSALREAARRRAAVPAPGTLTLRLAHRAPLHADALLAYLGARAVPGVEQVTPGTYRRALALPHGPAEVSLTPGEGHVGATLRLADVRDLAPAVARCRRLCDLDADPVAVDHVLAADPALAAAVAAAPGVRVPRAADGFELAVRAIVGQQVAVSAARAVLARIVAAAAGTPRAEPAGAEPAGTDPAGAKPAGTEPAGTEPADAGPAGAAALAAFPAAAQVAGLPDAALRMPAARRAGVRALAAAVAEGRLRLDPGADRDEVRAGLLALPGIGPWTAGYVALRALGDPDAFLPTDLGARRGARALGLPDSPAALADRAAAWRPWRGYALMHLWRAA